MKKLIIGILALVGATALVGLAHDRFIANPPA